MRPTAAASRTGPWSRCRSAKICATRGPRMCSACLNMCPACERTGGQAYGSVYPGPIGAILDPLPREARRRPGGCPARVAVEQLARPSPAAAGVVPRPVAPHRGRLPRRARPVRRLRGGGPDRRRPRWGHRPRRRTGSGRGAVLGAGPAPLRGHARPGRSRDRPGPSWRAGRGATHLGGAIVVGRRAFGLWVRRWRLSRIGNRDHRLAADGHAGRSTDRAAARSGGRSCSTSGRRDSLKCRPGPRWTSG